MSKNTINIKKEADLIELKSKLIREDEGNSIPKKFNNEVIINFALEFANKYYGIHEYGDSLKEIERQINKRNY